ncbi:hypothetical protein Ocin01_05351 [Orchesella cincta]|uniref:CRIB domain-containing protein n=1 Tax=Orchesella cincta TaxID=48709 RepID=A0A1D2N7X5_ORCCI|nr:hypothetical protein Ocin01_05351 [Orchesella cincta]
MRKGRIRKEDIGGPSNFVHVQHVGFGQKKASLIPTQRSFDLGGENGTTESNSGSGDSFHSKEDGFKVERRNKNRRQSQIPRHHRSTTAGIFPDNSSHSQESPQENQNEMFSQREKESVRTETSLKPTFGSLLNLSFLPLGLGKSSSKSPSVGKTKRMSLLNLTASNLFANPKALEEKRESVHMTGYFRRRSISNSTDEDTISARNGRNQNNETELSAIIAKASSSNSSRVPLAKLGRSKSTMSEFSKRPKLRLIIAPPPTAPPPIPVAHNNGDAENLPSPPPSPVPSPPSTPMTAPVVESTVVLRRPAKSPPRPRIIPLPSTSESTDSGDPTSPQYLTPAGGSSPQPDDSAFPLLSPTLPPTITPLCPNQRVPGTPPMWPLQPVWPPPIAMQQKEATIPELPSPCKDEMESSEYEPVLEIVEGFISENSMLSHPPTPTASPEVNFPGDMASWHANSNPVNAANIERLSSILRDSIQCREWPSIAQKLFQSVPSPRNDCNDQGGRVSEIYDGILTKTLELWVEMAGDHATVDTLAKTLSDVNPLAADLVRQVNLNETEG